MDEFLDNLFSSSSWSDVNAMERTSWVGSGPAETSGNLEVYERDDKNSPTSLIPSSHIMESLATQDTSILAGGESTYGLNKGLVPGAALPQQESPEHETKPSLNGVMNGNSKAGYLGLRLNTTTPTLGAVNLSSPKLLPVASGSAKSPHALPESGSFGSNDCESSELQESLTDSHSLPSIPQFWSAPSYGDLSSLSPVMGQDKLQGFGLQGEYVDSDANILGSRYIGDNAIMQLDNLPASMPIDGREELQSHNMSSFTAGPQITLPRTAGMTSQLQLNGNNPIKHYTNHASFSQLQPDPFTGGCNGAAKPRVRARRGQATDPHSIAERLRREKISERMKNLQELVPNSNKTDKASMLDEIIDYVKFLQLQVKVLSMSRLGAAGAVVPLITDGQAEGSSGFLLNPSAGQGADLSESVDNIAFEQEVVKLMESNVTMAMQYLQTKGLCLMPIALAAAISGGNASGPISDERKKPGLTHGVPHNGSPGVGTQQQISSDGETLMKANGTVSNNGESITSNGCNGTAVKHEEVKSTPCSIRDLQPKA